MAAQVDIAVDQKDLPGTTTLPAIQEGRPNLVSPPQEGKTPSLKEAASQWAYGVRTRLSECIGQGKEVSREDVCELEREIITGFITALQQDSHSEWMLLCEKLAFLEPFKGCFTCFVAKDELFHYLERILHHMELHKERLFDVQVTQTLSKIFPKEVCEVKEKGGKPARTYCGPSPPLVKPPCSPRKFPRVTLPDGSDPFDLRVPDNDETYLVVKPLSFGDLRKSFGAVALEVASREAVWGHCLGTTFQALSTNIPEEPPVVPEEARKSTSNPSSGEGTAPSPRASPHCKTQASPRKPMTGREAVLYLAGCHHIGKIETLFLNIAPHRHFRPYDLIEVHQNDINKEHYVFSTFSILHVYGDQPSERLSLAEWQREAVLWNAVSHIPFFKNYLRSKMFHRWRTNKLRLDFLRKQKLLEEQLLQAVPRYAAALLQISRLLKELLTVNFLPLEAEASYTIATFENLMNYRNVQADKTLEKFFNYCKVTADVTAEESFKLLAYCEDQVQKKSVFSKDSLHLQRLKKEQREANLLKARRETGRLGNLVKLMDQLVMEHLFEITKTQVCRFVDQVMRSRHDTPDRDGTGLFQVNLVFTKHDVLGLSPEREKILSAVLGTLKDIPVVLCARATPGEPQGVYEPQRDAASAASSTHKSTKGLVKALDLRRKQSSAMSPSTPINATMDSDRSQKTLTTMISDHGSEARGSAASRASRETKSPQPGSLLDGTGEDFPAPELPKWAEPTKKEDDLGVATPDLVLKRDPCLYVDGEGFMGQYHPLSTANLQEKLAIDKEFQAYLESAQEMVEAAMLEVDQYCEANAWLNQIHLFTSRWTERSVRNFAGVAAFTIEQKLNEIRQWSERIRIFDQSFLTENGLIYVDCCHIHDDLRPQLDKIYLQLVTFVADEVKRLSREFCKEMSFVVYTLKEKRKTVEAFASYAKNFNLFKKNTPQYQQQLDYIKSLFEVIRMSYRQLSSDEEKLEESVLQSWEAFLYQIQAASEFVNTQTPLFSQQLENTYTVLEKEAYELADKGTSGIFLDPNQDPTQVLTELKKIRMRFFSVREQLTEASWRREAISGDPYDLTYLTRLTQRLDVRYELWKYVEVSALAVADWKNLLFKKLNTRKALEKLVEWQTAAGHLKVHLPQGDEVLALWYRTLQDFKTKLPLLHKLRHESLKERHWKAIFVGIGDVYDPRRELLVSELLSFNLDYNDRLIEQICGNALGEYDLEVQIQRTAKFWREREFKLAKHIPDSVYNNKDLQHKIRQSRSGRSKLEKFRMEKQAAMVDGQRCLDVTSSDFYILTAADQLHYEIEDSLISIHAMLSSPHLACMEQEVRFWSKALNQIQEITELWLSAQEKWLYLLKLFEQPEIYRRFSQVSFKFESINKKFQDFMKVVLLDPKCLSVTNHRRGDRGYRLLQGDNLSALLTGLITAQEEILRHLESLLEEVRQDFPRLHFLSDSELVAMLGVSRNPEALVPTVNKCFLGIENVKFSLPPELDSLNTSLDYTLHADKLCAVSIQGRLGETVNLCESLEPQSHPTKWLTTLERLMRSSLAQLLQAAVQARMEGAAVASGALEELGASIDCDTEPGHEPVFQHWLLKFPAQCVLVSEAVLWEKTMTRILDHQNPGDLGSLISRLQRKVEEYTEILREDIRGKVDPLLKTRLRRLLSNLVGQAIYIRDVTTDIKKSGRVSLGSFDWLKVLKYHIDIKSVLRAKTEVSTASPEETHSPTPRGSPQATARVSPTRHCHTPMDKVPEESPRLPRTKTTVSSAYSFSQCVVHMLGSPFSYDYEYHGPSSRLVLTPLTERAFISLTSSLQSFHCGTLVGPPATGKSQSIQELSRAMGRHLVTVSCNEEITLPLLTQYLSGMIQSGSWVLFDNAGRLTQGLMSVLAQQVDYVRSALKALNDSASSQYNLRGQPRYDKKPGTGEKVIRRNSLTTLHPLPPDPQPGLPRQNTVPHGFNEKGLSTYFEDRWVEEREGRRHSIEREIRIQESELYKSNKPPPLFYEHVMSQRRKSSPDYSKLSHDDSYQPHFMGNLMFNGRLMLANASYGCFMTFNSNSPTYSTKLPHQLRLLIRPCALVVPDSRRILEVLLYAHGFEDAAVWTNKLSRLLFLVDLQLPSKPAYCSIGLREMKTVIALAGKKRLDHGLDREIHTAVLGYTTDEVVTTQTVHSREEFCLVTAVNRVLLPRMETLDDRIRLRTILHELFPSTIRMENKSEMDNPKLKETLSELLRQNHQFSSEDFLNKILQLQSAVEVKRGAVLVGPSGSGKTTCYRTLAEAWNHLNYQLFAPDHTKEQIDIHKMILSTTPIPQGQSMDSDYDYNRLQIKEVLKLQSLEAEDREARHRWRRAEKDLVSMLNTKTDIQSLGSEVTPTHALYPKVHLLNITPNALTPEQLFGSFDEGLWTDGILTQTLRGMETQSRAMNTVLTQSKVKRSGSSGAKATQDLPSYLLQWLILDGTVNPSWSENLNTMLDEHRRLSSADRENIGFQDSAMVLFETSDLSWASPAMVARTTVIHFDSDLVQWKWLYESWAETCKTEFMMTSSSLTVLNDLVTDVFGPTLKFLANECAPSLLSDISQQSRRTNQTARGIQQVSSFLKILSSLLSKCFLRDDLEKRLKKMDTDAQLSLFTTEEESGRPSTLSRSLSSRLTTTSVLEEIIPNHLDLIKSMFVFSYVWAFGGCLHDRHKEKFDKFVREMLLRTNHPLRLPSPGLVYDYQVDMASGGLVRWSEHSVDRPRGLSAAYVITPEVACYQYLLELLLGSGHSVLLTGPTAVGKSSLVQNVVALKQKLTRVQMSAGMTSDLLRSRLLSHLQDNAQGQPVVSSGSSLTLDDKRLTFFIDDLNTAHGDQFCQPPLELLREVLGEAGVYDLARKSVTDTREATFLALATSPSEPGSGLGRSCHVMSSRLTRLLVTLTYFQPCSQSVLSVVRKPILSWLEEFPTYSVEHHQDFADAMSLGLLELYQAVKEKFRPTPAHAHYLFSFHDISRAIQGILLMSPRSRTRKIQARRRDRDNARSRVGIEALQDMLRQTSNVSSVSAASGEGSAPMMRLIAQLWCHECTRVFSDRLINPQDLVWYQKTLESVAIKHFCSPRDHWQTNMTAIDEEPSGSHINGRFTPVNSRPLTPSEESNKGKSPMTTGGHESVEMPDFATPRVQSSSASQGHTPGGNGSQGSDVPRSAPMSGASAESTQGKTTFTDNVTTARSQSTSGTDPGPNDTLATLDTEALAQTDVSSEEADSSSEDDLSSPDETDSGDSEMDKSHYEEGGQTGLQTELNPIAAALASRRISKQSKRGVTFKTGLVMGNEQDSFDGPLMTVEELKGGHKNLTDIMFSKYYMKALTESKGLLVEKGYVESSESKLTEALYLCLKTYNAATSQQLDVAFFSDAVRHAARLGRVMAMPGGHALLLGVSYSTGRSTLTKLAACIAQRKVYEPKSQATPVQTRSVLREHIRRCCLMAGVGKRPAVLLVHEALGEECLRDVSCLMAEGTCPGLYTEDQLQDVVAQMMPGGVQTKRVDKIDQAFERFLKNVRQNLHVIVCLNYAGNSFSSSYSGLRDKLEMCPALIKHAVSIDVYRQWDNNAYVTMASRWLRHNSSKIHVPWSQTMKEEQITQASAAMGYVHLSARAACEQLYCHHTQPLRFYTPRTFMEFTRMFKVVAAHLAKREQGVMERYERLLGKMSEALATISAYKKEVSELIPQFSQAKDHIQHCMDQVEEGKTQYKEELELCRVQEEKIAELQRPMEHLRTRLSSAYDKARPSYEAAKRALSALDDKATAELGELKSYRQPPATVTWVVGALCVLFDRKEDWDSGKQLLLKENLVNDLIFYDKENIPPGIFNKLERYVKNPDFTPSEVRQASAALSCMCAYIHAVYNYALIHKGTYPLRQNLMDAMSKFDKAQAKLGQMRVAAGRKKGLLEKSIENYKDAVKDCKALEKRIMSFEKRIRKCTQVVTNMKPHHTQWKTEVKKAKAHIETAPGDALITAACVCYFGPLDDKTRAELLQDWMKFCRAGNLGTIAASDASVSLSARLDNLMDQNQSVFSEGGFNPKDPTKMTAESECAVNESNSYIVLDSVTVKDHSDGRVSPSVLQGDNPSGRRVYRYRPSIQESSIGKLDLRSDPEDVGSTLFSVETEGSDTDEEKSPLMLRQDFSLPDTLSSETELQNWKLQGLPTDSHALQNALIMRVCCDNRRSVWPLLVDPDGQAETWVRALQQSSVSMREAEVSRPDSSTACEGADISDCVPPSNGRHTRMSHFTADTTFTMADDSYSAAETSMSHPTKDDENLRPVTAVTQSWDTNGDSVRVEEEMAEPPRDRLWVVEADHPQLHYYLINSIVHGFTILVTHLERKPLDPVFRGVLFKQLHVDGDGNRVVRVGGTDYRYHTDFRLYLTTDLPLFTQGDRVCHLPVEKMCVIGLGLSDIAMVTRILDETMEVERAEFHTQVRSNNKDLVHNTKMLRLANDVVCDKVLGMETPLLKDKTLLASLQACEQDTERHRAILEETNFVRDSLEQRRQPYVSMATQVTMLYAMARKMSVLDPLYYLPFFRFIQLFRKVLETRNRGKGVAGDILARSQELSDATTGMLHKYVTLMMPEKHAILFSLLVAMERMRLKGQLTNQEMALFINGFEVPEDLQEASQLEEKPDWLSEDTLARCMTLESLHEPFQGLVNLLQNHSSEWDEYFHRPLVLMNPAPGTEFGEMSVFQKCLLWKIICPDKVCMIAEALTVYELGAIISPPKQHDIKELYSHTNCGIPTVFIQPQGSSDDGFSTFEPVHELKRLAREEGMDGRLRILSYGVRSQMAEVRQALEDCATNGYWLLLENYHLAEPLDQETFTLLKTIVNSQPEDKTSLYEEELNDWDSLTQSAAADSEPVSVGPAVTVCPSFRLFVTTAGDQGQLLPGILIQHGLKVHCGATRNFRSRLHKAYRNTAFLLKHWTHPFYRRASAQSEEEDKSEYVLPLALLHAVLLHRRNYGSLGAVNNNNWSLVDLVAATDMFRALSAQCNDLQVVAEGTAQVYGGQCTDPHDEEVIKAIGTAILNSNESPNTGVPLAGCGRLLDRLSRDGGQPFSLKAALDSLHDITATSVSLSDTADDKLTAAFSRVISCDMVRTVGAPELFVSLDSYAHDTKLQACLRELDDCVEDCPELPETSRDELSPLDVFYHYEVERYKSVLETLKEDLGLLQRQHQGEISISPETKLVLDSLSEDKIPRSWLGDSVPPCSSALEWLKALPEKLRKLSHYISGKSKKFMFELSVFLHPSEFLHATLMDYARQQFKNAEQLQYEAKVLPFSSPPTSPPETGLYLCGLILHNAAWDRSREQLTLTTPTSGHAHHLPIIWLSPTQLLGSRTSSASSDQSDSQVYFCPVFSGSPLEDSGHGRLVTRIAMATGRALPSVWTERRVFISTDCYV